MVSSTSSSSSESLSSVRSFILLRSSAPKLRLTLPRALTVPEPPCAMFAALFRISSMSKRMRSIVSLSIIFSCFCSSSCACACCAMESSLSMNEMRSS